MRERPLGQRTLSVLSLGALLLSFPLVGAVGYQLDSLDHPGSLFVYDDLYELNDRVSFLGERLDIQFDFVVDEDVQMRLNAFENHTQVGTRTAEGNLPRGSDTLVIPNLMYRWMEPGTEWTITDGETTTTLLMADDPDNVDRGYAADARSSQVVDLAPGVKHTISGSIGLPSDLFGLTPDLDEIVWDLDADGSFDEFAMWVSVTAWPTRNVDPNVTGSYLDTIVADAVIRLDVRPELEVAFQEAEPLDASFSALKLWPGARTYEVPIDGMIEVDLNEPVLADFFVTGELAKLVLRVFINGVPALDQFGNPLTWIPGQEPPKIRLPAGVSEITFIALTDAPGEYEGDIRIQRSNLIDESFSASVSVAPVDLGWGVAGGLAILPVGLLVFARRRYRFVEVPAWNAGVCTKGRKAIGIRSTGGVIRFEDIQTAAKEQDLGPTQERYGSKLTSVWLRQGKRGVEHRPLPQFAFKKAPRDVGSKTRWYGCRSCPARDRCWDPRKRQK